MMEVEVEEVGAVHEVDRARLVVGVVEPGVVVLVGEGDQEVS